MAVGINYHYVKLAFALVSPICLSILIDVSSRCIEWRYHHILIVPLANVVIYRRAVKNNNKGRMGSTGENR
jgi:hypothetical protein